MQHLRFLGMIGALTLAGCDSTPIDPNVLAARKLSQQIALANANAYVSRAYPNNYRNLACDADDDIETENLRGDGDADCQFLVVNSKKKMRLECATLPNGGCKKEH